MPTQTHADPWRVRLHAVVNQLRTEGWEVEFGLTTAHGLWLCAEIDHPEDSPHARRWPFEARVLAVSSGQAPRVITASACLRDWTRMPWRESEEMVGSLDVLDAAVAHARALLAQPVPVVRAAVVMGERIELDDTETT